MRIRLRSLGLLRWKEIFPTRRVLGLALFVCVVAPATFVWLQIDDNPKFSPIDEPAHFDYVDRISHGEVPRQGQRLLLSTLREQACRSISFVESRAPPCDTPHLTYGMFSATWQYEAQQPPIYYAVALPLRWAIQHIFGIEDKLRATRAANIIWLAGGLLLLWAAGTIMGIAPLTLGAALLLLVASPNFIYFGATVTNDITGISAAGLVAFVAALAYRHGGAPMPIALFAAGALAAGLKITNLFVVVTVSAAFAVRAVAQRPRGEGWPATMRHWLSDGGALLAGGLATAAIWGIIHRSRSLIDLTEEPSFDVLRTVPRTFGLVAERAIELFTPLGTSALSDSLSHPIQVPLYRILAYLLIAAALAGLFASPRRWPHVLGLISVTVLYVGGMALGAALMINYDIDPRLSGRYAISMGPLGVLVLAGAVAGKWARRALVTISAVYFLTMFGLLLSA